MSDLSARALMIQGTGSNVGKSLLVAGLCRAALRRGLRVLPFKPQNMSNNAAVTVDGGEIGRAQALQALACGVEPHTDMNPVLLKPESETGSQVIVQGQRRGTFKARDYAQLKSGLLAPVLESFNRLKARADLVIVEGAGSPAEVNLRANDIANMGFARAANVPVVLAGDIDRGGIIAQLVGTKAVLEAADEALIAGFLVNKFRGDPALFEDGYRLIEAKTGWRGFGVLPYFAEATRLPAEDAQDLPRNSGEKSEKVVTGFSSDFSTKENIGTGLHIAALAFSRIANFDDLDPLSQHPGVKFTLVRPGEAIPGDCALVILPGSKSTRGDLAFLRAQGWDIDLAAHIRRGGRVLGLCGGYQMLGRAVHDLEGIEGAPGSTEGLGWLDVETTMTPEKRLARVEGVHVASGAALSGYEIHIGRTEGPGRSRPFAQINGQDEGAVSADGRIIGTYLHGVFSADAFRSVFLAGLGGTAAGPGYNATLETTLDALAAHIEAHLDVEALLALAR